MNEKNNDFIQVMRFLWKWKFYIGGISLAVAIITAIFSGPKFVTPRFEAYSVFYPSSTMSVSRGLLAENAYSEDDFLSIGEGEEAEQLLQILQSDIIANKIKKRYKLMEHYGIDPEEKYANHKFGIKFAKNVKSKLTEYTSIKVSVRDIDPVMAANIANDMVEIMDTIRNNILKSRALDGLKIVQEDFDAKKAYVQSLVDSMNSIAQYGVFDFQGQSEALSAAYADAISKGNQTALSSVERKLDALAKYGPTQAWLAGELEFELDQLVKLRAKLKQIKADANNMIPTKFVIDRADVPERKAFPKRSLITLISFFTTLVFSTLVFAFMEHFGEIKKS